MKLYTVSEDMATTSSERRLLLTTLNQLLIKRVNIPLSPNTLIVTSRKVSPRQGDYDFNKTKLLRIAIIHLTSTPGQLQQCQVFYSNTKLHSVTYYLQSVLYTKCTILKKN